MLTLSRSCVRRGFATAAVQMDWLHHATYSRFHPDNLHKLQDPLPSAVAGPPPTTALTEVDKKVFKAWGHKQCCEKPFGPCETSTRIKDNVTSKVGADWRVSLHFERGASISNSAMYGGSYREPTFEELVELKGKKG